MALDYSLHPTLFSSEKRSPSLPQLPHTGGQKSLALGANSAAIAGPCEICLVPEEKVRLDIRKTADVGALAPADSPLILPAGSPSWFYLAEGSWTLKVAAA